MDGALNRYRAAKARQAIRAYQKSKWQPEPPTLRETIVDLLADLRHFARVQGIDFQTALNSAQTRDD